MGGAARICVIGSFNIDLVARVARFPAPGETVTGRDFSEGCGGKGSNQAVQAARCGAAVAVIAAVGRDRHGDRALALWRDERIDAGAVRRCRGQPTGTAIILVDGRGENQIVVSPGANATLGAADVDAAAAAARLAGASLALAQLEVPAAAIVAAFRRATAAAATTVLNPAPADRVIPPELWACTDVVTPNAGEAARLAGCPADTDPSVLAAVLARRCRRGAVLTLGAAGALVALRDGGLVGVPAPRVAVVDTTGAGDAFNGAFATRLAETGDLVEAARWGVIAGAIACTGSGALGALPGRAAIESRLGEVVAAALG